jgi:hypothetical protein
MEADLGVWQAMRLLLPNLGVESGTTRLRKLLLQLVLYVRLAYNTVSDNA